MNKRHWNTVILDGSIPEHEIIRMIDHSYALVVKGLKKSDRSQLELHYSKEDLYK
jgi:predicted DNA-binding protein (MmcQ/YjbR family)